MIPKKHMNAAHRFIPLVVTLLAGFTCFLKSFLRGALRDILLSTFQKFERTGFRQANHNFWKVMITLN
jgi:hypothetical protein